MRLHDYAPRPAHIKWLLDSDPAIRWQVMRDLDGEAPDAIGAQRSRVATEGWGAQLLALQSPAGNWGGPKWDLITLYSLVALKDLGLDPASKQARKMIDRVDSRLVFKWLNNRPYLHGETEPCINGRILGVGSYFKEPNDALANQLLGEQLEDGGWNCEAWPFVSPKRPPSRRSSFHTTICVLEGLLEYERAGGKRAAVTRARKRAENYLLERRMFRSLRTGEVIDKRWLRFSFPTFWHYDVLRGLDYLRNAGVKPDSRVGDAIKTVIERRHQNGAGRSTSFIPTRFPWKWRPVSAAPAAGTHCALSESCVGTTTQSVSSSSSRKERHAEHVHPRLHQYAESDFGTLSLAARTRKERHQWPSALRRPGSDRIHWQLRTPAVAPVRLMVELVQRFLDRLGELGAAWGVVARLADFGDRLVPLALACQGHAQEVVGTRHDRA